MTHRASVTELIRKFLGPAPARPGLGELMPVLESLPPLGEEDANALAADLARAREEMDARWKD